MWDRNQVALPKGGTVIESRSIQCKKSKQPGQDGRRIEIRHYDQSDFMLLRFDHTR